MADTTVITPPQCEARTGVTPGDFGFQPVRCDQTRGLRTLVDGAGKAHHFCPAAGHAENVAIKNGAIAQLVTVRPIYEGMD